MVWFQIIASLIGVVILVFLAMRLTVYFRATRLLLQVARGSDGGQPGRYAVRITSGEYEHTPGELQPFDVYGPIGRDNAPLLVILHGATSYGEKHAIIQQLARALAAAGITVVIPRLPKLKQVLIDSTTVESIFTFYSFIQGSALAGNRPVSLMSTSFAGGFMLKALLDQRMWERPPGAILAYGSYCDLETTLRYILTGGSGDHDSEQTVEPDPWGQIIFFYNYLDEIDGDFDRSSLKAVLEFYINDRPLEGDAARQSLGRREQELAELITTPGNPDSLDLAMRVLEKVRPRLRSLSPAAFCDRINFPLWILHGKHDRAVPYTEALRLKSLLGSEAKLMVTELFGHRDLALRFNLPALKEMVLLITFIGRFLRALEQAK
ncbi:MAG: hypothetical protein KAU50_10960 [Candidatus Marinimicrobia bacterium]|nr:hypothetical protein [Candidatus Neomarinimicrobiota bacterium]